MVCTARIIPTWHDLNPIFNKAKINIHPPQGEGEPWSMKVNTTPESS
ncbi:hypothetical protein RintRC_7014 [Richelia intracellularis]|nr:hypothetical protein RintRC_7014 [Richelia intracellularis]